MLAARLSKVMDKLNSTIQSAFIGKRNIMDGIVILNEAAAEAKRRKVERALFKINVAKAYDSVNWDFLDMMLEGINFCNKWRDWIQEMCI